MSREETPARVPGEDPGRQAGADLWETYGAARGVWSKPMLMALEKGVKGNKWFSLIDKVVSERTFGIAWGKVESNAGACGVDNTTVRHFAKDSQRRLLAVREQIRGGRYHPRPVRRVHIPKPGSRETRPLGIPTVTDRVVQAAVKLVIEPIFEHGFSPASYGFRPGRCCKDALREVERQLRGGRCHVVDIDIRGYFDNIPHEALMRLVERGIADSKVLGLIEKFLKMGVMEEGVVTDTETGSPQGGIISPLLANIYLDPLDWLLSELGLSAVRYADDIVVLAENAQTAGRALDQIAGWMAEAGLQLHPEKTRIVDMNEQGAHFDFLGYRFLRWNGKILRKVRPKSKQKLRSVLRKPTKRCNEKCMAAIIAGINPVLRGWSEYFRQAQVSVHKEMDGWVRMRLRSVLRKRHKGKGRGRGLDHTKWPNSYFDKLGLFSLKRAREEAMSLRQGAKC